MNKYCYILSIFIFCVMSVMPVCADNLRVSNLKVEYESMPMGVNTEQPRFSWQMTDNNHLRGRRQVAYRIVVADSSGETVWDSKKVYSDISLNIAYGGQKLRPSARYSWFLEVWDQDANRITGESYFETSLSAGSNSIDSWSGAQWIGVHDADQALYAQYLPVFRLGCTLALSEKDSSRKAAILYGGNDERLQDSRFNHWNIQADRDSSYIKVELDASGVFDGRQAQLIIYRKGYSKEEHGETVIKSFLIPADIVNSNNVYLRHRIDLSSNLGETNIYLDGSEIGRANLNPAGAGGDFIAYPVVGDVGVSLDGGQAASFSDFTISNYRSPSGLIASVGELDILGNGLFRLINPSRNSMPRFRSTFNIEKDIKSARLYVTARGVYDFMVNGQKTGTDYLNPGITQYNKTHLFQTFDITELIHKGENVVAAMLGEGWWCGGATFEGKNWNYFGDRLSLLAKLTVTYSDGTIQNFVSNPAEWKYSTDGPVIYSSLFQGEVYDARKEAQDWTNTGFDDSSWKTPVIIPVEGHVSSEGWGNGPAVNDYSHFELIPQYGQTIRENRQIEAKSVIRISDGAYIYDMGQNMVGIPRIKFEGMEPGTKIKMRYAEVLYPDLPEYKGKQGTLMLENIRAAMAQDLYIAKGGEEIFSPHFTNHGYRYIEISGISKALPVENVRGIVLSSIERFSASYETSDTLVNKLWNNILWSSLGNFMSVPTDCPQRNERLGWAGDISVFSRTATYLAELPQFLRRYLRCMRDVQRADGRMPDIAPLGGGFGGMLWGSASITVAWEDFLQYGDKSMLAEHYDAMAKYIDYIHNSTIDANTNIIVQDRQWGDLGDWLGLEDGKNDKSLFWEAYFIYDLDIMSRMAAQLGRTDDERRFSALRDSRKQFFIETYIDNVTGKTISSGFGNNPKGSVIDTQTSYVLPLALNVVEGELRQKMMENLVCSIEREGRMDNGKACPSYSLLTGFIGTSWINNALSDGDRSDVAYRLLLNRQYPSWLYPVTQGATTIWERLNSYTHSNGFGGNNRMNSFNHYSFGAVGAWLINHSLGIRRDESCPGFKHFFIKPEVDPTGNLSYAKGHYDSMYGRIESQWKVVDDGVIYCFTIPANTSATVMIPSRSIKSVRENGHLISKSISGIASCKHIDGYVMMELYSGKYSFTVSK